MGAGAGHARWAIAAIVAVSVSMIAGQGTAAAEGCLYQDEALSSSNQARVERSLLCSTPFALGPAAAFSRPILA